MVANRSKEAYRWLLDKGEYSASPKNGNQQINCSISTSEYIRPATKKNNKTWFIVLSRTRLPCLPRIVQTTHRAISECALATRMIFAFFASLVLSSQAAAILTWPAISGQ
jgi:hypothetical protein